MSLSSTASAPGRRPVRVATALAVVLAVLAPLAVLGAQVWTRTGASLAFTVDERRGVEYLAPLTELLSAAVEAQSAAVRGQPVDPAPVRAAVAEVDRTDARLGGNLRTTERWRTVRATVEDRVSRPFPVPSIAYTQYSDLVTALLELNRTVGDNSRLILDPSIDSYYVMNATLLRIPEILVDSGRYADLTVLAAAADEPDPTSQAQLSAARNRIATDAADLADGLLKAFGRTGSSTLGPGLTRQLDNFRTAVDEVAPSTSLLAPAPSRSLNDLVGDQQSLQRAALDLQRAALEQLDTLLADREAADRRTRLIGVAALVLGGLVALGLGALALRGPRSPVPAEPAAEERRTDPGRPPRRTEGSRVDDSRPVPAYDLSEPVRRERPGGARAAR